MHNESCNFTINCLMDPLRNVQRFEQKGITQDFNVVKSFGTNEIAQEITGYNCPVCRKCFSKKEFVTHYYQEVNRLKHTIRENIHSIAKAIDSARTCSPIDASTKFREVHKRLRANRQDRLNKNQLFCKAQGCITMCDYCGEMVNVSGTLSVVNHLKECLVQARLKSNNDESFDYSNRYKNDFTMRDSGFIDQITGSLNRSREDTCADSFVETSTPKSIINTSGDGLDSAKSLGTEHVNRPKRKLQEDQSQSPSPKHRKISSLSGDPEHGKVF